MENFFTNDVAISYSVKMDILIYEKSVLSYPGHFLYRVFYRIKYTQNLILKAPLITKAKAVCTVERPHIKTPVQFISNS